MMEIKNLLVETVWALYQWLDEDTDNMLIKLIAGTKLREIINMLNESRLQNQNGFDKRNRYTNKALENVGEKKK